MDYELVFIFVILLFFILVGMGSVIYGFIYAIQIGSLVLIIATSVALFLLISLIIVILYELCLKDLIIKTYKWFKETIEIQLSRRRRLIQEKKDKKVWLEIDEILVELLEEKYLILIIKDYLDIKN